MNYKIKKMKMIKKYLHKLLINKKINIFYLQIIKKMIIKININKMFKFPLIIMLKKDNYITKIKFLMNIFLH